MHSNNIYPNKLIEFTEYNVELYNFAIITPLSHQRWGKACITQTRSGGGKKKVSLQWTYRFLCPFPASKNYFRCCRLLVNDSFRHWLLQKALRTKYMTLWPILTLRASYINAHGRLRETIRLCLCVCEGVIWYGFIKSEIFRFNCHRFKIELRYFTDKWILILSACTKNTVTQIYIMKFK